MESSSSSTPALGFAAKTGGTESTRVAVTTWNSRSGCFFAPSSAVDFSAVFNFLDGGAVDAVAVEGLRLDVERGEEGDILGLGSLDLARERPKFATGWWKCDT